MPYTTGTADNYRDLLAKLTDYLTGTAGWSIIRGQRNALANSFLDSSTDTSNGKEPLDWDVCVAMGWGDYGEDDAFDVLNYSGWSDFTTNGTSFLGFEATSTARPYSYQVKAVVWGINDADASTHEQRQVSSWVIEYSNDNSSWTTADTVSGESWTTGQSRVYTIDQTAEKSAKYWRMRVLDNNGDPTYRQLGRLRFRDISGDTLSNAYSPEMIFRTSGYSGTQSIYTYIQLQENDVSDWYNWSHGSFLGWMPNEHIDDQPFVTKVHTALWQSAIPYVLCANAQRFMLSAKVSTVSEFIYMGFFLPYATPEQYPYPYISAGTIGNVTYRWSNTSSSQHSSLQSPNHNSSVNSCKLFTPTEEWFNILGRSAQVTANFDAYLSPVRAPGDLPETLYPNDDGTYTVIPYILHSGSSTYNTQAILGELEGFFWVTGIDNAFEDIIQIDGVDYFVIQNTFNTSWNDYACMKLE